MIIKQVFKMDIFAGNYGPRPCAHCQGDQYPRGNHGDQYPSGGYGDQYPRSRHAGPADDYFPPIPTSRSLVTAT